MGSAGSILKAGDNPQVFVRRHGKSRCPLHRGNDVTTLCSECNILVCLECMTSSEHKGHTFIKFKDCLRDAENKIAKRIKDIGIMISNNVKELLDVTEEIKIREEEIKTKELNLGATKHIEQFRKYYRVLILSLRNYETFLKMYKRKLQKDRMKYATIMKSQSDILRYDTGIQLSTDIMDAIQGKPNIPELTNVNHFDDVMKKLQNEIGRISIANSELMKTTSESTGNDTNSMFDNESPRYYSVTPISADTAWVGEYVYNEHNKKYHDNKKLRLITSTGTVLSHFDTNGYFIPLSVHPTTGLLYGGFYNDKKVRCINTTAGITTTLIHCECKPKVIKVTHDDHVLVATWKEAVSVYRYQLTGNLVHKSTKKYQVDDIDHCPTSKRVLLSCGYSGVVVLDNQLNRIHTFTGLSGQGRKKFECYSAIFDNSGNIIVGDGHNKQIYILDGKHFGLIHKLHIDGLSKPRKIRLYQNTLWVTCKEPRKIMCTILPYY